MKGWSVGSSGFSPGQRVNLAAVPLDMARAGPTERWGWACAATTGTTSLSGDTGEGKGLAGARASLDEADSQVARGAKRMGSQSPSLCCHHWGICHHQEKRQSGLQLHPR